MQYTYSYTNPGWNSNYSCFAPDAVELTIRPTDSIEIDLCELPASVQSPSMDPYKLNAQFYFNTNNSLFIYCSLGRLTVSNELDYVKWYVTIDGVEVYNYKHNNIIVGDICDDFTLDKNLLDGSWHEIVLYCDYEDADYHIGTYSYAVPLKVRYANTAHIYTDNQWKCVVPYIYREGYGWKQVEPNVKK